MASSSRRRKRDTSKDVGEQLLLSFGLLESLLPIDRGEFEQAIEGPGADQAEQITDVAVGLDVVQPGTGEQGNESGVGESAIVAADKQPVSAPQDLPAQIELADVFVCGKSTIVDEAPKRDALVSRVAQAVLDRRLVEHLREFGVAPPEELVDDRQDLSRRTRSLSLRDASAMVRSTRNSAPMCESATLARSGSDSSALKT